MRMLVLGVFVTVSGACGGSGLGDPSELVASWRKVPASFEADQPVEDLEIFAFASGGTFTKDERHAKPLITGTYSADSEHVTLTAAETAGDAPITAIEAYVTTADRMMLAPMLPDGDLDGVIGVWRGVIEIHSMVGGPKTLTSVLTLRADGTSHEDSTGSDGNHTFDGTWTQMDAEVVVTTKVQGVSINAHLARIPGIDALGGELFEKL